MTAASYWSYLTQPPGRKVSAQRRQIANWLASLPDDQKRCAQDLVKLCVHAGTFHTLTVLDGSASIERSGEPKGQFFLTFECEGEGQEISLRNPESLHDLYGANYVNETP